MLYIAILLCLICAGSVLIFELKKERKHQYAVHARDAVRNRQQQELDAAADVIVAKLKAERKATAAEAGQMAKAAARQASPAARDLR
jgi:hypothetical protein